MRSLLILNKWGSDLIFSALSVGDLSFVEMRGIYFIIPHVEDFDLGISSPGRIHFALCLCQKFAWKGTTCHERVQELQWQRQSGPDGLTHAFSEGLLPGAWTCALVRWVSGLERMVCILF